MQLDFLSGWVLWGLQLRAQVQYWTWWLEVRPGYVLLCLQLHAYQVVAALDVVASVSVWLHVAVLEAARTDAAVWAAA